LSDVDYKADLNLFNVSTLADYHPWKNGGFRLKGKNKKVILIG
jgi:hypothetical protein